MQSDDHVAADEKEVLSMEELISRIKKAAAVVEVHSTTIPSHFTHFHPVKNFSSVTQLKQEPNVLNKVSSSNNTFFILF
jgi:hypothetical protein